MQIIFCLILQHVGKRCITVGKMSKAINFGHLYIFKLLETVLILSVIEVPRPEWVVFIHKPPMVIWLITDIFKIL